VIDDILQDAEHRMDSAVGALDRELDTIRTGRARPALVEGLKVEYYGSPTPLNQMATINAPEPRLITIQPWDKGQLTTIEKAIQKSDLGLNPTNDGNIIRLVYTALTENSLKVLA
jgi:ribosome recycling factor